MTENLYSLPNNWRWEKLENICEYIRAGGDKPKDFSKVKTTLQKIPVVANGLQNDGIVGFTSIRNEKSGTITIAGRGTIGHAILRNYDYYPIVRLIVLSPNKNMNPKYLKYIFDFFVEDGTGSTIPQLTIPMIKEKIIPVPPLSEQKRIAALLDSLFEKLDAAKTIVQKISDGYELRRAAILYRAFTGKLTENFRAEHGMTLDDWQEKTLGEILSLSKEKTETFSENLKYVGLENIAKGGGKISFQSADGIKSTKNIFYSGDLLYGKLRPYLNKHGIANFDGVCSTDILVFNSDELSCNEFINYFFNLPHFIEYAVANSKGINLPRVSSKTILDAEINLPPLNEQKEIVSILEKLLANEQRTKDIAENVLRQIDALKKNILTRAFRGEFFTNDPAEINITAISGFYDALRTSEEKI